MIWSQIFSQFFLSLIFPPLLHSSGREKGRVGWKEGVDIRSCPFVCHLLRFPAFSFRILSLHLLNFDRLSVRNGGVNSTDRPNTPAQPTPTPVVHQIRDKCEHGHRHKICRHTGTHTHSYVWRYVTSSRSIRLF